jgi:hypothetical protein
MLSFVPRTLIISLFLFVCFQRHGSDRTQHAAGEKIASCHSFEFFFMLVLLAAGWSITTDHHYYFFLILYYTTYLLTDCETISLGIKDNVGNFLLMLPTLDGLGRRI